MLVRHGATDWSEAGRHTGWTDIPLNGEGVRQAGTLGPRLADWSFDAVVCSTLQRAVTTCECAGYRAVAELDADLREWNYGDYEGLTAGDIRELQPGWNLWDDGVPNGEALSDVAARADRVLDRLRAVAGDVVVFAHGHFLRVLAARWIDQGPQLARHLNLSTASVSTLAWEHDWPSITLWNDARHLRALA
ncbi:MAG TPA: histidine phosphatase family protein [Candidatus Deferrimicrobium sp.]|nr:histidine phosphatase family protein [Candidatus Deferrimicrobium sp.]